MSKVILQDNRPTKIISLPSFPESQVEIWASLLFGDVQSFAGKDEVTAGLETIPKLIKSWNFTDPKGADLPINSDTIKMLPITDTEFIMKEIASFSEDQKKS